MGQTCRFERPGAMHGWFSRRGGSGCLGHMQWSSGGALPLKTCGQGGTVPAAGTGCACRALHTFVGRSRVFNSSWPAGICLPGARLPGRVSSADGDGRSHACGPSGDCVLGTHPFNRTLFPGNNGCAARFAPTALPWPIGRRWRSAQPEGATAMQWRTTTWTSASPDCRTLTGLLSAQERVGPSYANPPSALPKSDFDHAWPARLRFRWLVFLVEHTLHHFK